jgi:glucan endo-1,3-alpha-glucosidase
LKPDFIELVTWNDWGESSYIGPADTTGLCPSCYWSNLDHSAFLKITQKFVKAYKAGQTSITVSQDEEDVFFFYRLQSANKLGT